MARMIRLLQLLDHDADFQTHRAVQTLCQRLGEGFEVTARTIGRGGAFRNTLAALLALRRGRPAFDLAHAWGASALGAASVGFAGKLAFSPAPEGRPPLRWLRAALAYRDIHALCPTSTLRKTLVTRGVPPDRCHLIRPGVDFARARGRRDLSLRKQLGLAEDDYVLLAAGESTQAAAHPYAVWAAAMLAYLDPRYRLLVWGRGREAWRLMRFVGRVKPAGLVISAEGRLGRAMEFEALLPAADAVLVTAGADVATLPISMAMAAGLPIVSTVPAAVGELLEDRHNALLVSAPSPRQLARRVLDLREDPGLQWTISDVARTEAFEYFSQRRFVEQHRAVYRQLAGGERVEVPEEGPGAGLRFHGRG